MCAACNSYDSQKCGEGGGECGEGENKSCAWSGRLAFSELPGPWNWDLATPPLNPLVPLSSRHLSLPGAATSAARCPPPLARAGLASKDRSPLPARLHPPDTLIRQLPLLPYSLCKSQHEQVSADGRRHLGLMELFAFCFFFFFKYLNRFAQHSNFEAEHADARTQPPGGERPGVGVRSGRAGLKSAGWPANSWMTGAQGLFFFRIWLTESPCVPPTPHPTHTYTPRTSGCLCARVCLHALRVPA